MDFEPTVKIPCNIQLPVTDEELDIESGKEEGEGDGNSEQSGE